MTVYDYMTVYSLLIRLTLSAPAGNRAAPAADVS